MSARSLNNLSSRPAAPASAFSAVSSSSRNMSGVGSSSASSRPRSTSCLHLVDLEPGGVAAAASSSSNKPILFDERSSSAAPSGNRRRPSLQQPFTSLAEAVAGETASDLDRTATDVSLPGQPTTPAHDDDDEDERSLAMDSFTTAASTLSGGGDFCKICHCGPEPTMPLIAPCYCCGSLKYVHQECLQKWIKSADIKKCELCKYSFVMESKVRI